MSFRSMEQGIAAIQSGNMAEGARLLRIALRSDDLKGPLRATAYLWLAETKKSREEKMACYNEAMAADPGNQHARERIALLYSTDLPPVSDTQPQPAIKDNTPPPPPDNMPGRTNTQHTGDTGHFDTGALRSAGGTQQNHAPPSQRAPHQRPQTPNYNPNAVYRTVGIFGGPNGRGSGFFVTRDGLLATTRFVVGGETQVTVELEPNNTLQAQVVRSFPELDLAFIHTGLTVNRLLQGQATPVLPDNMPLTALAHQRRAMSGYVRQTRSDTKADWFPTTISDLNDAGGNPVFNDRHVLIGMLTHNANRTSPYVYGININAIYRFAEHYSQESRSAGGQLIYCPGCGILSRAGTVGGYYCEMCGSTLPTAENVRRSPLPQLARFYGETMHRPCPNCDSRVGFFNGACLRCGYQI